MESVLAIIPARGGSKVVPGKNIRPLNGKPLIAYSIEHAAAALTLTRTIVSTDYEEIAQVAREHGGDVPFLRPPHLAEDHTPTLPVLQHALEVVEREDGRSYAAVVILQPTSPLRNSDDIDRSVRALLSTGADTVVTVCEMDKLSHPYLVQHMDPEQGNRMAPFWEGPEFEKYSHADRSQLPPVVRLNAAVYVVSRKMIDQDKIIGQDVRGIEMEADRSIDIDTEEDVKVAEALLQIRQQA